MRPGGLVASSRSDGAGVVCAAGEVRRGFAASSSEVEGEVGEERVGFQIVSRASIFGRLRKKLSEELRSWTGWRMEAGRERVSTSTASHIK